MPNNKETLRCAIYTRKSSEEGLEQEFNSLDAQRESCEAYIVSQKHEGWEIIRTAYDDGGFSGGNMKRPGLKQLLAHIEAGLVDVVVVYKVDRLSRALSDFAKMVEIFDGQDVSFVSVTQQFNTTTSMGRLTLNVLLSFAQFEREVTGERIRDKFAASKKKGMWMGGNVPLGFHVVNRKLVVSALEAKSVRHIYRRYLALKSVRALKQELDDQGYRSKIRTSAKGNISGGKPFARGALYAILQNKHYLGLITHKGEAYPGEHERIVDDDLWNQVQKLLIKNGVDQKYKTRAKEPSLLSGRLYDHHGNRFSPSHSVRNKKRYRYYVNQAFLKDKNTPLNAIKRIPAYEIEKCVTDQLLRMISGTEILSQQLDLTQDQFELASLRLNATVVQSQWKTIKPKRQRRLIQNAATKVILEDKIVTIEIAKAGLAHMFNALSSTQITTEFADQSFIHKINATLKQCQWESRLVIDDAGGTNQPPEHNPSIIKAIAQAHHWRQQLLSGKKHSMRILAEEHNVDERYISRRLNLAYLAPDIVETLLAGRQSPHLTLTHLESGFVSDWQKQRIVFK